LVKDIVVKVAAEGATKEQVKEAIDREVEDFSNWMANVPNPMAKGHLIPGEKALIRTYLMQKYKGAL
jgi:hypothetical protein